MVTFLLHSLYLHDLIAFFMSGEQLTAKESINTSEVQLSKNSNTASRVNINDLLSKVKQEEKKEKTDNYIFLGLICAVIAFTGIVASL